MKYLFWMSLIFFSGCSTTPTIWKGTQYSQTSATQAAKQCKYDIGKTFSTATGPYGYFGMKGDFKRCMEAKGFIQLDESQVVRDSQGKLIGEKAQVLGKENKFNKSGGDENQ